MSKVFADKNSFENLVKKYPSVSKKLLEIFVKRKCIFYSEKNQEELEIFGFEDGKKNEFIDKIKDFILLVQQDYEKPKVKKERTIQKIEEEKEESATEEVLEILKNPNLLEILDTELNKKVVGEHDARKTLIIQTNMRNVENLNKATDNISVNAGSGAGKEAISEAVFELIPENEKEELIRITPKVLAYTRNKKINPKASWKKVSLRIEDASNQVLNDNVFKVISSANPNKINKAKAVSKDKIIEVEIEGKPPITLTIADANPKEEMLRRYPICTLDEGINQTKEILKRQAKFGKIGKTLDYNEDILKAISLLKRVKVKIPFAEKLVGIFCPENTIVRTHFPRFLDYIKSSCSLHQFNRKQDEEGFFIAEKQDYDVSRQVLIKTTTNILMIPLTKLREVILSVFEKENLQRKSVDESENYSEIKKLNISQEWLRKQLDWLVSKGFLSKEKERREDERGNIIPKPVYVYSYNPLQKLIVPEWKDLDNITSFTSNKDFTSNSSITSNTRVNEVNEVIDFKKNIIEVVKIGEKNEKSQAT